MNSSDPFMLAQEGFAKLKVAVHGLLSQYPDHPMTNAEIGKTLGIYAGHLGHVGHISRTILEDLRKDGLVDQDPETKAWFLVSHLE